MEKEPSHTTQTEQTRKHKTFFCKKCNVRLINERELKIHSMLHSSSRWCIICKEVIKNRNQFIGHIRRHMHPKPFCCPTVSCHKSFSHSRLTKLHQKVHNNSRPFECEVCGKGFKNTARLREHGVVHTGEKRFRCKICDGGFSTRATYTRHVKNMHEAVRSFECNFCRETFNSREILEKHKLNHRSSDGSESQKLSIKEANVENKFSDEENKDSGTCEYCVNKTFYFSLKSHIEKSHTPQSCEMCKLTFYDYKSFQNHQKSHLEVEFAEKSDLTCILCKKQFDVLRYLKAHMKRHEKDYKKFICHLCEKGFPAKRDLKDHIMVHIDSKNYFCDICNKAFRTKQSVAKHRPIHSDLRPFECEICSKSFKRRSILSKHLLTHSKLRPFKCDCGKDFKSRYALNCHMKTHNKMSNNNRP